MVEYAETLRDQDEKTAGLFVAWSLLVPGKGVLLREWAADAWREERGLLLTGAGLLTRDARRWLRGFSVCRDDGWRTWSLLGDHQRFELQFFIWMLFSRFHFSESHQKALAWTEFYAKGSPVSFVEWFVLKNSHIGIWKWIHSFVEVSQHIHLHVTCPTKPIVTLANVHTKSADPTVAPLHRCTVAWIRIHGVVGVSWFPIAQLHIPRSGVQRRCIVLLATWLKSGHRMQDARCSECLLRFCWKVFPMFLPPVSISFSLLNVCGFTFLRPLMGSRFVRHQRCAGCVCDPGCHLPSSLSLELTTLDPSIWIYQRLSRLELEQTIVSCETQTYNL